MKIHPKLSLIIAVILMLSLILVSPIFAQDSEEGEEGKKVGPFPEDVEKYGVFEGDNRLDPRNPSYDPSLRYGSEGSRFGPPGKRNDKYGLAPDHPAYGTVLAAGQGINRIMAKQEVHPDTELLEEYGDRLYAPTMLHPDYSRLETLACYIYSGGTTCAYWSIYRHDDPDTPNNDGGFVFWAVMDEDFVDRYTYLGYVFVRIDKTYGPQWSTYIFDYDDFEWDYCYGALGESGIEDGWGWDAWEEVNLENNWPDGMPEINSKQLWVRVGETLYWVTSTYGDENDTLPGGCPYEHGMNADYYDWYVGP